jgi:hypothetical protein
MSSKQQEFLNMPQGSGSVYEYGKKFNYLAWYRGHHMDTDVKKMKLFKKGLGAQLREHLTLFRSGNFNELIMATIEQEDASRAHMDEEEEDHVRPYWRCSSEVPPSL